MTRASLKRKVLRTGIVLFCLSIPFLIWRVWLIWAVDSQISRIRSAGLPTNGDELNKWYAFVPESENAALVLTKAFELRRDYSDSRSNLVWNFKLPPRGQTLTSDQVELLSAYLELNGAALVKANEGLKLSASRYPIDCSFCMQTPLPHLAQLVNFAKLNQYEIELSLIRGDTHEAAGAIASILRLTQTLENEPMLISQLVRLKILGMGIASLERSMSLNFSAAEATNLAPLFMQTASIQCLGRALIGERAMAAPYFRSSRSQNPRIYSPLKSLRSGENDPNNDFQHGEWGMLRLIGYYELDFGQLLFTMNNVIKLASLPPPDNLEADKHFAKATAASRKKRRTFSALVFSTYIGAAARENESLARLRLAVTALAIEQFRGQNGKLPDRLEELKPAFLADIPEDPFTGDAVRYRRLPKGYIVYSVGRDLVDDGGNEEPPSAKSRGKSGYDITFIVER
jgi:hypothetical protein